MGRNKFRRKKYGQKQGKMKERWVEISLGEINMGRNKVRRKKDGQKEGP